MSNKKYGEDDLYTIDKATGCWNGNYAVERDGCCQARLGAPGKHGRRKKIKLHIFMYEKYFGSVPKGYELHHLCKNRRCCNIFHLKPVTRRDHQILHNRIWTMQDLVGGNNNGS
jgi:hypothetical protein